MNIFVLDTDPLRAARYYIDQHIGRTILDSARMLWTAHVELDGLFEAQRMIPAFHFPVDVNHSWNVWTRQSVANYDWLYLLLWGLLCEFYTRYGHRHNYATFYKLLLPHPKHPTMDKEPTAWPQVMPNGYRQPDVVKAYREYYFFEKSHIATWKSPAKKPDWWIDLEKLAGKYEKINA